MDAGTCYNCKQDTKVIRAYGMDLCTDCENKISLQLDGIRDTQRRNTQQYGNKEGTINIDEYLYGEQHCKGWSDRGE